MADNQQVNIRATADTQAVSDKLDVLSAKIDMMGNKAKQAGGKAKQGSNEAKDGFAEMGAEAKKVGESMVEQFLSVTAVITGLTAAFKEMIQERARAAGEAAQDEATILFGTGDSSARTQIKNVLTSTASVFPYKEELEIFGAFRGAAPGISRDDVLGTIPEVLQGPGYISNDLNSTKSFAEMAGKLMQQGYSRDEALSRAMLFMQQAGNRGGDLVTQGATLMGQLGAISKDGKDTALALQLAGIRSGVFSTEFVASTLGQLEARQRAQAQVAARERASFTGEDETAVFNNMLPRFLDPSKNLSLIEQAMMEGPNSKAFRTAFTSAESATKARAVAGAPFRQALDEVQGADYNSMIAQERAALGTDARLVREIAMNQAAEEDAKMAQGTSDLEMKAFVAKRRRQLAEEGSLPLLAYLSKYSGYGLKNFSPLSMTNLTSTQIAEFIGGTGVSDRMSPMGPEGVPSMGMTTQAPPQQVQVQVETTVNVRSDDGAGFVADIEDVQTN